MEHLNAHYSHTCLQFLANFSTLIYGAINMMHQWWKLGNSVTVVLVGTTLVDDYDDENVLFLRFV
jgi:hypothetical protein